MKTLILWTGIGTSLQTAVLHHLWKVSEEEANEIVDDLWKKGLVQFANILIPPHNTFQSCVEVHAVISQYVMEHINSKETLILSPFRAGTGELIGEELKQQFMRCYGVQTVATLSAKEYLAYKSFEIENSAIPFYLKRINSYTITDPHTVIAILQEIRSDLNTSARNTELLQNLCEKIEVYVRDCKTVLNDAYKLSRKLNQNVQFCLTQGNYNALIQTLEKHNSEYPVSLIAQNAATNIKKIIPCCEGHKVPRLMLGYKHLLEISHQYHHITLMSLPIIKLQIECLKNNAFSLNAGSYHIDLAYMHYFSGKHDEQVKAVKNKYYIKRKEICDV